MDRSWIATLVAEKDQRIAGEPGRKKALLMAFFLVSMGIPVYLSVTDSEQDSAETDQDELTDWQVHFANAASDLPECNENRIGWLYFVSSDQSFQGCTSSGWELIDVTGPSGADGLDGANGQSGTDGTDGVDGLNGADGISTIINAVNSTSCLNGGTTFEIGSDDNADGVLSVTEVKVTVDICNGTEGPAGADGQDGADGAQGPAGADGQDGADGADGATGPQGPAGADGQDGSDGLNALVSMTPEAAGSNCANGGTRIDVGIDDNSNGQLESSEIDQTQYVCDGGSSNNTMLTSILSPPTNMACDAGGRVVSHGLDNGDGGGTYANGVLETGEIDSTTTFCSRFVIQMLMDINSGSSSGDPDSLTAVGNTLYFRADDGTNGKELWKTDGTTSGTVMVKDINSGSSSGDPNSLTAVGNTLYFRADDGTNGYELWKTDGTTSGTVMVKDIWSGSSGSFPSSLTAVGNTLYFHATDGTNGYELWTYQGVVTEVTYS
jgi:ELWxxDGT repeat protein